jgi:hypothetical protein
MPSRPQLAQSLQHVLSTVPEAHGRSSGFIQRQRKLSAATFVQILVFGWLAHPTASLAQLTQIAAARGVTISPQGLAKRFSPAASVLLANVLEATVQTAMAASPVNSALLHRFTEVLVLDSTTISLPDAHATTWPGCGGRVAHQGRAALKLTVLLDLVTGRLTAARAPGRTQDRASTLQHTTPPPGSLRVADRGFWSLGVFRTIGEAGAFWVSHLTPQVQVFAPAGTRLDLPTWLATHKAGVDVAVTLGKNEQLAARLIAERVPAAVAEARRARIRAEAQREGRPPSPAKLALASWTVIVTNVPAARLSPAEAVVLLRARWQIELLFKLWKSGGQLATSRSQADDRVLCEVSAKLIALVIQHWLLLTGTWGDPARSLVRGAQTVRTYAILLVMAWATPRRLVHALGQLMHALAALVPRTKRRKRPSTAQLLADPLLVGLS